MNSQTPDINRRVEEISKELSMKALMLLARRPSLALRHFKYRARGVTMAHHSVSVADVAARIVGVACIADSCPAGGVDEAMKKTFVLGLVHDYAKIAGDLDEEFGDFLRAFASEAGVDEEFVSDVLSSPAAYASVAEAGVPLEPVRFPPDIVTSRAIMVADLLASMERLEELLADYTLDQAASPRDRYQEAINYLASRGVSFAYMRVDPWVPHRILLSQASLRIIGLVRRNGGVPLVMYGDGVVVAFPRAVKRITYDEVAEVVNASIVPPGEEIYHRLKDMGFIDADISRAIKLAVLIAASRCVKAGSAGSDALKRVAEDILEQGRAETFADPCKDAAASVKGVLGDVRKLITIQRVAPERPPSEQLRRALEWVASDAKQQAVDSSQTLSEYISCSVDSGGIVGAALALTAALPKTLEFRSVASRLGYSAEKHDDLVREMCDKGLPRLEDAISAVVGALSGKDRYDAVIHIVRGVHGSLLSGSPPRPAASLNVTCTLCGLSVPEDEVIPRYFAQDVMKGGRLDFPFSAVEYWVNQFPAFYSIDKLMGREREDARAGRHSSAPFRVCVLCNYENVKKLVPPMIEVSFNVGLSVGVIEALDARAVTRRDGKNMLILDYLGARLLIPPRTAKKGNIVLKSSVSGESVLFSAEDGGSLELLLQHPRSLALTPLYYYRDIIDVYLGGSPAIIVDRSGGRVDYEVPELEERFDKDWERRMPHYVEVYRYASQALKAWSRAVALARRVTGREAYSFPNERGGSGTLLRVASRIDWGDLLPDSLAAGGAPYVRVAFGGPSLPPRKLVKKLFDEVFEALEASFSLNRLREVMGWMGVVDLVLEYSRGVARLAGCKTSLSFHKVTAALRGAWDGVELYFRTKDREEAVKLASAKAFRRLEMSETRCRWQREECLRIAEIVGDIAGEVIAEIESVVLREREGERRLKDVMHMAYYFYLFFAVRERETLCPKRERGEAQEASSQAQ